MTFGTSTYGSSTTASTDDSDRTELSGTARANSVAVSGAKILVVDDDNDTLYAITTTDGNGDYSLFVDSNKTFHLSFQYDDGETKYNSTSRPYIDT